MKHIIKLKRGKKNQNKKISSENQPVSSTLISIVKKKKKGGRKNQESMTENSTKMNVKKETVTKMVPIKRKTTSKQLEKDIKRGEKKGLRNLDLTTLSIKRKKYPTVIVEYDKEELRKYTRIIRKETTPLTYTQPETNREDYPKTQSWILNKIEQTTPSTLISQDIVKIMESD